MQMLVYLPFITAYIFTTVDKFPLGIYTMPLIYSTSITNDYLTLVARWITMSSRSAMYIKDITSFVLTNVAISCKCA